jgi:hypothetical protein
MSIYPTIYDQFSSFGQYTPYPGLQGVMGAFGANDPEMYTRSLTDNYTPETQSLPEDPSLLDLPFDEHRGFNGENIPVKGETGRSYKQNEEGDAEVSALAQLGFNPSALQFDKTGHVVLSPEDRKQAMAASIEALGAGILAGASSGSWQGVAQGISGGMSNASKVYRDERDKTSDRKMKNELYKMETTKGALSIEEAKLRLQEAKDAEKQKKEMEKVTKKAMSPLVSEYTKGINAMQPDEGENPATFESRKAVLKAQLIHGTNLVSAGLWQEGLTTLMSINFPGIQEYQAKLAGKLKAEGELAGQEEVNKSTQAKASKTGAPTETDELGNTVFKTEKGELAKQFVRSQISQNYAAAENYGFSGGGRQTGPSISDAESKMFSTSIEGKQKGIEATAGKIVQVSDILRKDYGLPKELEGASDVALIEAATDPSTKFYKTVSADPAKYSEIMKILGVDPLKVDPGKPGAGSEPVARAAAQSLDSIVNELKQGGVGFDNKTKNFGVDIRKAGSLTGALSNKVNSIFNVVEPPLETQQDWFNKFQSDPSVAPAVESFIQRHGGPKGALIALRHGTADADKMRILIPFKKLINADSSMGLERGMDDSIERVFTSYIASLVSQRR